MSMRDKAERDRLKNREVDSKVRTIHYESLNELLAIADERDLLQMELERLRNYVPGDVERLINEYVQLNADWVMLSSTSERVKAFPEKERKYNELLALIGSLIDRKREDLEGAFQACLVWMLTHPHHTVEDCQLAAKAYAERKMKGVKK